jgi:hypothetical protein
MRGQEGEEQILAGPEERFGPPLTLRTFGVTTPTGATRVSVPELPYHLHIVEDDYTADLESWGRKR